MRLRAKFRIDEQKSHIRLTWDGRLCQTRRSPMLPESHTVDAAVTERRLLFLLGEVCKVRSYLPIRVSRVERQRLNLQKSASLIVPKKWLTTTEGRGGR